MRAVDPADRSAAEVAEVRPIEIELKLRLEPKSAVRLQRNAFFRALVDRRAASRQLYSEYFDSPRLDLKRKGIALRVRRIRDQYLQTVKADTEGRLGLQTHVECEAPLLGAAPDPRLVDVAELRAPIEKLADEGKLLRVFVTEFKRLTWQVAYDGADIEVALDQGEVVSQDARMPVCELELELKGGDPSALQRLALALSERVPMQVEHRTKAARGYALFTGGPPRPVKATPVQLDRRMTVWQGFCAVAANCLKQIQVNADVVLTCDDPEGIHQARVGIRRLRAAFSLFRKALPFWEVAGFREDLGWLQRELGSARDWDVFIEETLLPLARRVPERDAVDVVTAEAAAAQAAAWQRARLALSDPRTTRLVLALELWLQQSPPPTGSEAAVPLDAPALAFAARSLRRLDRAVWRGIDDIDAVSDDELHALRIRIKKVRYAAEFFRALFADKQVATYARAMAGLQDHLGGLNDAEVAKGLLETLAERRHAEVSARAALSRARLGEALIHGWFAARIEDDRKTLNGAWTEMLGVRRYWKKAL